MPGPRADIDREGIAASVALHGQRETARRTGVPLGTVQRIAIAAGVRTPDPLTRPAKRITEVSRVDAGQVGTPAHAVVTDALAGAGADTRLNVALRGQLVTRAALERATIDPERALAESPLIASEVKAQQGANVPGFEREVQSAHVAVNILHMPPPERVIEVDTL